MYNLIKSIIQISEHALIVFEFVIKLKCHNKCNNIERL